MPWKLPTAPKHSEITLQMAIIDPEVCVGASTQVKYSPSSQDQKLLYPAQGQEGLSAWYFQVSTLVFSRNLPELLILFTIQGSY